MDEAENRFGVVAVQKGFVTTQQLRQCLEEHRLLLEAGKSIRLGQLLMKKRLISSTQFLEILRAQGKAYVSCTKCEARFNIVNYDVEGRASCPNCGGPLEIIEETESGVTTGTVIGDRPQAGLQSFGPYRELVEIGRGGMGVIYRAYDPRLEREVALKVLRQQEIVGPTEVARFLREARAAAQLQHPNIVTVFEVGQVKDSCYYTMQLVEGEDLEHILEEPGSRRKALRILYQAARGLGHAHQHGVLHRDVKPSNILVDSSGIVRVMDFGLAKTATEPQKITAAGVALGTTHYMSPEQVRGDLDVMGPWTDVYGLGVILYRILTGRLPHEGKNNLEVYKSILEGKPTPPSAINRELDPALEAVCLKAIAKETQDRHVNATAFMKQLERCLKKQPVRQPAPQPVQSPARPAVRRPARGRSRRAPRRSKPREGPGRAGLVAAIVAGVAVLGLVALLVLPDGETNGTNGNGEQTSENAPGTGTEQPEGPGQDTPLPPEDTPPAPEELTPLIDVTTDKKGELHAVEGEVLEVRMRSNEVREIRLGEGETELTIILRGAVFLEWTGCRTVLPGARLRVAGRVGIYRGEVQLEVLRPENLQYLKHPSPIPIDPGSLPWKKCGEVFRVKGTISNHEERSKRGVPDTINHFITLSGGEGSIVLVIFHDTYEMIPPETREGLQEGARLEADIVEREYKGAPGFILENPFQIKVLR